MTDVNEIAARLRDVTQDYDPATWPVTVTSSDLRAILDDRERALKERDVLVGIKAVLERDCTMYATRAAIAGARISQLEAELAEARRLLNDITTACEQDCTSELTEDCSDFDAVGSGTYGAMSLTFVMMRRARAFLSKDTSNEQ